jgi:hypothetical protein
MQGMASIPQVQQVILSSNLDLLATFKRAKKILIRLAGTKNVEELRI